MARGFAQRPRIHFNETFDRLLIIVYVDDILVISGNFNDITKFKKSLSKEFDIKEILNRFGMTESNLVSTPIDINVKLTKTEEESSEEDKELPFRELVGALVYLAVATRPDISFAVSTLSQ